MYKIIVLLFLLLGIGCVSSKPILEFNALESSYEQGVDFEILPVKRINGSNNEDKLVLKVYNISSAMESQAKFYQQYGPHTDTSPSTYLPEFKRFNWRDLSLLGDERRYTITTDGYEDDEFFATIRVMDQNDRDVFNPSHRDHEEVLQRVLLVMEYTRLPAKAYSRIKRINRQ